LICEGDSLEDDLGDKEAIQETITEYACKKGSRYYDISDIKDPVMKMATHLVTKLNGQERWTQVNKPWLHVCRKITEGTIYNLSTYIAEEIVKCAKEGDRILFGNVLLTIVFAEVGVSDAPDKFVWEYPAKDPSPAKRFEKYACDTMTAPHKARLKKWYTHLRNAFGAEWRIPEQLPAATQGEAEFAVYQHYCLGRFKLVDESWSPWCKLPFTFTTQYFQAGVNRFKESKKLRLELGKLDQEHRDMRKKLNYPR
ncbi:hypothetical protein KI387_042326, partial [Taxus chinensis]